jgi:hypothetical protein
LASIVCHIVGTNADAIKLTTTSRRLQQALAQALSANVGKDTHSAELDISVEIPVLIII